MNSDENYRKLKKIENKSIRLYFQTLFINKQIKQSVYQTTLYRILPGFQFWTKFRK